MSASPVKPGHPNVASMAAASGEDIVRIEAARYIADLSGELAKMARASGLHLVSYFLDMAEAEALSGAGKLAAGEPAEPAFASKSAQARK
jgi:hypothetical protein